MSNSPANDQLSAFLDGELDETEAASLEAALEADADLRAELEKLRNVQRLLRTHGRARAPEGFAQRVIAAAEAEGDNVVAGPWWRRPFGIPVEGVLIAAAAALVLIVALPKGTSSAPEETTAPAAAVETKGAPAKDPGVADANADDPEDAVADARGDDGSPDEVELGAKGAGQGGGGVDAKEPKATTGKPAPKPVGKGGLDDQGVGEVDEGATDNAATPEGAPPVGTPDPEDPVMASAGIQAQLYTESEEMLGTLQATVSRYGGVIRDPSGKVVNTGLFVDTETILLLDVPADRISELTKALQALGVTVETTSTSTINAGSSMKVPLRVLLTGNGPSTDKPAPVNSVRKNKLDTSAESADDLMEIEQKL